MDNISDIRYCAVPPWPGDTDTGYRHIALSRVRHNQTKWDREERRYHKPPEPFKLFACGSMQLFHYVSWMSCVIPLQWNVRFEKERLTGDIKGLRAINVFVSYSLASVYFSLRVIFQ